MAAKSADALAYALRRGGEIGARGVVVHTGSAAGWAAAAESGTGEGRRQADAREHALRQIGEITLPLLDKLGDDDPDLLFEPMAGQGQMLCARAGDLATYLSAVEHHPKAGVCLDTCHLFAAGHDLTAPGGVAAMLAELARAAGRTGTGVGRVKLVHANDSLLGCGSKRDRHETIGAGMIGPARSASCSRPCPMSRSSSRRPAGRRGTPGTSLRLRNSRPLQYRPRAKARRLCFRTEERRSLPASQSARPCPGLRSDDRGTREERRGKDRGPERAAASGKAQYERLSDEGETGACRARGGEPGAQPPPGRLER